MVLKLHAILHFCTVYFFSLKENTSFISHRYFPAAGDQPVNLGLSCWSQLEEHWHVHCLGPACVRKKNDGIISVRSRQRSLDVSEPEPFWCKTAWTGNYQIHMSAMALVDYAPKTWTTTNKSQNASGKSPFLKKMFYIWWLDLGGWVSPLALASFSAVTVPVNNS